MAFLSFKGRRKRVEAHRDGGNASAGAALTDDDLLRLFRSDPRRAWDLFLDRYASYILSVLRHMGFDHDAAMDRFVYVCEKLADDGFRRLRNIERTGDRGELKPWLRTVVRRLAVSWAWSKDGRRRLFKSVAEMPLRRQRIFELYFWQGRPPFEICEHLRVEEQQEIPLVEVLDALEDLFDHLDSARTWRLMSRLARDRPKVAVAVEDPETGRFFDPPSPGPDAESRLLSEERRRATERALDGLEARNRLILQLRYEESLSLTEIAEITGLSLSSVKRARRAGFERLRSQLGPTEDSR